MRVNARRASFSQAAPAATTPQNEGRFGAYDVLGQVPNWDEVTAGVVLRRLGPAEPMRFFSADEEAIAGALFDQLLDQHDEPRVPVLGMVDARLTENKTDGWHYEDMPADREAWHLTLRHLDGDARAAYGGRGFAELDLDEQGALVQGVQDTTGKSWHGLPGTHVWSLWTRYACTAFYAHPWAWNEIGFGGPAYPRGYKNLGFDAWERWEVPEHDVADPVVWSQQVEDARRSHAVHLGETLPREPR